MSPQLESMEKYFKKASEGTLRPDQSDFENVVELIRNHRFTVAAYKGKIQCLELQIEILKQRLEMAKGRKDAVNGE